MVKLPFAVALMLLLLCPFAALPAAVSAENLYADHHDLSAALLEDTQNWLRRTDLWNLVARGETLLGRAKIEVVRSNVVEAWVCGAEKICLSTRLVSLLP